MPNLLFEIYTEEIPASYIEPALDQMADMLKKLGAEAGFEPKNIEKYATPRRLVLWATDFPERQLDKTVVITGPPESAAFKDGLPTKALEGFAKKQGVPIEDVQLVGPEGARKCSVKKIEKGRTCAEFLVTALPQIISKISFPKSMRWIPGNTATFARPVRSILALLDSEVVNFEWNGIKPGKVSYGHPFLSPEPMPVLKADIRVYAQNLKTKYVLLKQDERYDKIKDCILKVLYKGAAPSVSDIFLINEIKYLLEWPEPIVGEFDKKYLSVPDCIIKSAMTSHQRYFPVVNAEGKLENIFICFANRLSKDGAVIKRGNERVLKARLEDAKYFYEKDRKFTIGEFAKNIAPVIFHKDIGTYGQKIKRMSALCEFIMQKHNEHENIRQIPHEFSDKEIVQAKKAAELSKADLATDIVGEFPELQGTIGSVYAKEQGIEEEIAEAIEQQYPHKFINKHTKIGNILALAESIDNIAAFFAAGHIPTGAKDPFSLRRASNKILYLSLPIPINNICDFNLPETFAKAMDLLRQDGHIKNISNDCAQMIIDFIKDKFRSSCKEDPIFKYHPKSTNQLPIEQNLPIKYPYDFVEAVLASRFDRLGEAWLRLDAIMELKNDAIWPSLVEIVQRTYNIAKNTPAPGKVVPNLLNEEPEKKLWEVYTSILERFNLLKTDPLGKLDYINVAKEYHNQFKMPVHEFFDKVYVNVEDAEIRRNRIALSWAVNRLFVENIADLKLIVMSGPGA
jgi:glycyl-tRNA synthetase beta chain